MGDEAQSGAQGRAVDGGDDGFGTFLNGVERLPRQTVEMPIFALVLGVRAFAHVGPGGEHAAGAGQDNHAHIVAIGHGIESGDQLLPEFGVLRVHRRAIHHDGGDIVLNGDFDGAGHGLGSLGIIRCNGGATGVFVGPDNPLVAPAGRLP